MNQTRYLQMNNKLLDFVMSQMCDEYCKYPLEDISQDTFDEKCSHCTLKLFLELMDKK